MTPENLTRLRELASTARIEWRVADPVTKSYCATFDRSDTLTPEEDAHAWLEDHRKRFPGGRFAAYEVIKVEVRTELQRLVSYLLAEADRLNRHSDPVLLSQLHAQCKHLLDDLTVTTHDEHGLPEHSPVASLTYSNFIGALVPLVARAGAALAADSAPPLVWPKARGVGRLGDMSPVAHLRVGLDSDNDVYVSVWDEKAGATVEFCPPGAGGGKSSRTRVALVNLMVAMEADNADTPAMDWWAQRAGGSQAPKGGA